jgi:hypothetical protein
MMQKKVVVAYYKISQLLPEETEESHPAKNQTVYLLIKV